MVTISYRNNISYDDLPHWMVSDDDVTRFLKNPEFEFYCCQVMSPPLHKCPLRNALSLKLVFWVQ